MLEQARANQIPAIAWPAVASALAGTYVFAYGHKVFGLPENLPILTDPQVPERLAGPYLATRVCRIDERLGEEQYLEPRRRITGAHDGGGPEVEAIMRVEQAAC